MSLFKVAIIGEFQDGKSTLINCVLGNVVAPRGKGLSTTKLPVTYKYSDQELMHKFVVVNADTEDEFKTDIGNFLNSDNQVKWENQKSVTLFRQHSLLQHFDIIDTPGFNANGTDTEKALHAVQSADFAILLLTNHGIPQGDKIYLEFIAHALRENPYGLVFNCGRNRVLPYPNLPYWEEIEKSVSRQLRYMGLPQPLFTNRVNFEWIFQDIVCDSNNCQKFEEWTKEDLIQNSGFGSFQKTLFEIPALIEQHTKQNIHAKQDIVEDITPSIPDELECDECYRTALASTDCCDTPLCKKHIKDPLFISKKGKIKFRCSECDKKKTLGYISMFLSELGFWRKIFDDECVCCDFVAVGMTKCCGVNLCEEHVRDALIVRKKKEEICFKCPSCNKKHWIADFDEFLY